MARRPTSRRSRESSSPEKPSSRTSQSKKSTNRSSNTDPESPRTSSRSTRNAKTTARKSSRTDSTSVSKTKRTSSRVRESKREEPTTRKSTRTRASSRSASPKTERDSSAKRERGSEKSSRTSTRTSSRQSGRKKAQSRDETTSTRRGRGGEQTQSNSKNKMLIPLILAAVLLVGGLAGSIIYNKWRRGKLLEELRSSDVATREAAVRGLVEYRTGARDDLLAALGNQNAETPWPDASRKDAAWALLQMGDSGVDKIMASIATGEREEGTKEDQANVRDWVLGGILRAKAASRFDGSPFIKNAEAEKTSLRLKAMQGLSCYRGRTITKALAERVTDTDAAVRTAALQSLETVAEAPDALVLTKLMQTSNEPVIRDAMKNTLIRLAKNDEVLYTVGKALQTAKPDLATLFLDILGEYGSHKSASAAIAQAMAHENLSIRCRAIEMAGKNKLVKTYPAIITASKSDVGRVRAAAARAVMLSGSLGQAQKLEPLLKDPEAVVRVATIDCCWKTGFHTTPVLRQMITLLDDSNADVYRKALQAIKSIKSRHARNLGDDRVKWKAWWKTYQAQVGVVDEIEKDLSKVLDLCGEQTNEAYLEAKGIIKKAIEKRKTLLARKDLVPELKSKNEYHRKRLEGFAAKLRTKKYDVMKLQTMH